MTRTWCLEFWEGGGPASVGGALCYDWSVCAEIGRNRGCLGWHEILVGWDSSWKTISKCKNVLGWGNSIMEGTEEWNRMLTWETWIGHYNWSMWLLVSGRRWELRGTHGPHCSPSRYIPCWTLSRKYVPCWTLSRKLQEVGTWHNSLHLFFWQIIIAWLLCVTFFPRHWKSTLEMMKSA